ncbi:Peptidyl-prolyl cis-trans isomerase CYP23 [Diplonema papillatum]|nr:Peptidyl-prolyl cis-trans isomerase CYP23 [Diplonema papillatum]
MRLALMAAVLATCTTTVRAAPVIGPDRVVMHTEMGAIELGFYVEEAPATSAHMLACFRMGLFDTNEVFRVDKGFVAQVSDAQNGRRLPMNATQRALAQQKVVGEFSGTLRHRRGTLSMGRWDDPNSATHSFSMVLGDAPFLDRKYAIFGEVTDGLSVLAEFEKVETHREGIFVRPVHRIEISSTEVVRVPTNGGSESGAVLKEQPSSPHASFVSSSSEAASEDLEGDDTSAEDSSAVDTPASATVNRPSSLSRVTSGTLATLRKHALAVSVLQFCCIVAFAAYAVWRLVGSGLWKQVPRLSIDTTRHPAGVFC